MRVLVLRAAEAATRTRGELERLGHEAILAPLFDIVPTAHALPQAMAGSPFGTLIAASPNAIAMLDTRARPALAGLSALVVGERSAKLARDFGLRLRIPACATASELALAIEQSPPPGPVLYLAGADRRPEIEAAMTRVKLDFTLVETYAARSVSALAEAAGLALRRGEVDAVLHYSPRSAETYLSLAGRAALIPQAVSPMQLCLSAAVAEKLEAAGARKLRIAASPREDELLRLLG
jgi:uroporphyrinogen-III synthase